MSSTLSGIYFRFLFGSISGLIFGPFWDPGRDPKRSTLGNGVIPTLAWGIARGNAGLTGLAPSGHIAQSPSHSLSHPSDGFATTPARWGPARASVMNRPPTVLSRRPRSPPPLLLFARVVDAGCFLASILCNLYGTLVVRRDARSLGHPCYPGRCLGCSPMV